MKLDNIYTPTDLARTMVDAVPGSLGDKDLVADFAAGDGELLRAARLKWPLARIIATDIDSGVARVLKRQNSDWEVGVLDFLSRKSRSGSSTARRILGMVRLVILNPPFSCRGGGRTVASALGRRTKCSRGLAFVFDSVEYVVPGGFVIAVLPSGSLRSEMDQDTWRLLESMGTIEILRQNGHHTFPKATVETVVVRFTRFEGSAKTAEVSQCPQPHLCRERKGRVRLVRGNVPIHRIESATAPNGVTLFHSSDLREGRLSHGRRITNVNARLVGGPMVLIPRVGKPSKRKLVCYPGGSHFALSDCVIAALCESESLAEEIWESLMRNWACVEDGYSGSGAKYITMGRLTHILGQLGYTAEIIEGRLGQAATLVQL